MVLRALRARVATEWELESVDPLGRAEREHSTCNREIRSETTLIFPGMCFARKHMLYQLILIGREQSRDL